ncbi:MAG: DUF4956 domain-containing protein [Lachnospiraceae bacterium]|nr:DUF4956 domain-containing protein [Lachnospiraceae bacterium]
MNGSNVTTASILVTLLVTCILAIYIFIVYYVAARRNFYSKSFNISLALIAVITASIILAMQSNVVISLGMVGALSIVRFRTAIKDPTDLMFLFWAISVGIICGAGMFKVAIITSIILTLGLFLLELTPMGRAFGILIINAKKPEKEKEVLQIVKSFSKVVKVKSRNLSNDGFDMIIECKSKDEGAMLQAVSKVEGVYGVSLMDHDGEVTL